MEFSLTCLWRDAVGCYSISTGDIDKQNNRLFECYK